ncbi:MAG: hypothetical protein VX246_14705 [Myxococcota bacterium]|nr:hypothetical protein [Myxococcota bacterium]
MSIQPGRVLWRIVDEVDRTPRRSFGRTLFGSAAFSQSANSERMEIARIASGGDAPPFPTLLHFWTHALRGWLDALGQSDQLVGVAGYAMCEHMDEAETGREFERLTRRLRPESPALSLFGNFAEAYRMIDGRCRASFVVATDVEWLSLTWAHGFAADTVLLTASNAARHWQSHPEARVSDFARLHYDG